MNPYKIAPLTAVIGNGGYELRNASVRIVPKPNGQEIAYSVADRLCRTHGGIPVFGLYPDYQNTVEVEYDRVANDAARTVEHIRESYKIYAGPAYIGSDGTDLQTGGWFRAEVLKCAPKYKDRLYLVNNILENRDMHKTIAEEPVICASNENVYEWYCPTCGTRYESEAGVCVHCPYCGQKIDWSNYDSE